MELVWVTNATYVKDYTLQLTFNDGKCGLMDFSSIIERKLFEPLKTLSVFRNFTLNDWTVSWLDGRLDIAPETLYQQIKAI